MVKIKDKLKDLPIKDILSYSRIDTLKCPYKYKLKYIDKNYTDVSSLALNIGSICHKGLELKHQGIGNDKILDCIYNGYITEGENLKGLKQLQLEYPFEYYETNEKSGLSYEDKINTYNKKILNEKMEDEWEVVGTEVDFHIIFNDKVIIRGFIDRVDRHKTTGDIRVIDYKTNNKPFEKKDLATPMQMYIYSLACYEMYGKYPIDCIYDMIFLNLKQKGGTKGYMDRGYKKLNKILDELIWYEKVGFEHMSPKPTPLCYWCDYCENNPNSQDWNYHLCDYYSLWTPSKKSFKTKKEWILPTDENLEGWD